jgi:nicotinamide-nucleotide amidase
VDEALQQEVTAFFAGRGMEMPENNLRQATLIPSAVALRNASGTAPGWWVAKEGKIIVTLPGPPGEMQEMWQLQVLPRLKSTSGAVILSRTLKSWGLSEARVDQLVSPYLSASNPTLALYARQDGIHLRITAKAETEAAARKMLATREAEIRQILGENIWGMDNMTMEGEIGRLLKEKKMTLAVSESFTGGLLAYSLTGAPDSADFFKGGIVRPVKASAAGPAAASAMAEEVREQFNADVSLSVDGFFETAARSAGGRAFIAVEIRSMSGSTTVNYPGRLTQVARRAVNHALVYLINSLK